MVNGTQPWASAMEGDCESERFLLNPERLLQNNSMSFGVHNILDKAFLGGDVNRIKLPELRIEFENFDTFYRPNTDHDVATLCT